MKLKLHKLINRSFLLLGIILVLCGCNKNKQTDSIRNSKIDSLLIQARDSLNHNNTFSKSKIETAISLAKDSEEFYNIYSDYINYYFTVNSLDTVYRMTKRLIRYSNKQPLSAHTHSLLTSANNLMGNYHDQMCHLDSAVYYFQVALKHANFNSDKSKLPDICINLADMYTRKGDYINGISYYRRALTISDSLHITDKMGFPIYFGLGQAYYMGLRNFELSDTYFRRAEKLYADRTLKEKFIFCNNRGNFYYYKQEYANALPWFRKAKALITPGNNKFYINLCRGNMGDIFLQLNELDSAKCNLDSSFQYFSMLKNYDILYYLATVKAGLALKQRDTKKAGDLLKSYENLTNVEPEIQSIRNKYLQDYYAKTGDYRNAYLYQSRNTRINDSLRTERVNNRISEIDMRYKQDTAIIRHNFIINKQVSEIKTLHITMLLGILIAIAVLISSILAYVNFKRKRDLQQLKFVDANAKLRLQSIRNRISPHFIFNVLNREISSEEDKEKHKQMIELVKFLRRSLEITEQSSVTLAEEIDFVKNYLLMEQAGMGNDFHVSWTLDQLIKTEEWLIPAMIIQIPVENALKHALRSKEGDKQLSISVLPVEKGIKIDIVDNGDGYHPERITNTRGTGTGLKVLYQTIQLLNKKNDEKIIFSISNVKDEGIQGTKVEITIPEHYDYEL
jgi:tetratricopeptide (TPR) repeat protein